MPTAYGTSRGGGKQADPRETLDRLVDRSHLSTNLQREVYGAAAGQSPQDASWFERLLFPLMAIQKNVIADPIRASDSPGKFIFELLDAANPISWGLDTGKAWAGVGNTRELVDAASPAKAIEERFDIEIPGGVWGELGIDIVTDPLTYLSFGSGAAAKGAIGAASKTAGRAAVRVTPGLKGSHKFTKGAAKIARRSDELADIDDLDDVIQSLQKGHRVDTDELGQWALKAGDDKPGSRVLSQKQLDALEKAAEEDFAKTFGGYGLRGLRDAAARGDVDGVELVRLLTQDADPNIGRRQWKRMMKELRAEGADIGDLGFVRPQELKRYGSKLSVQVNLPFGEAAADAIMRRVGSQRSLAEAFEASLKAPGGKDDMFTGMRKHFGGAAGDPEHTLGYMLGTSNSETIQKAMRALDALGEKPVVQTVGKAAGTVGDTFSTNRVGARREGRQAVKSVPRFAAKGDVKGKELVRSRAAKRRGARQLALQQKEGYKAKEAAGLDVLVNLANRFNILSRKANQIRDSLFSDIADVNARNREFNRLIEDDKLNEALRLATDTDDPVRAAKYREEFATRGDELLDESAAAASKQDRETMLKVVEAIRGIYDDAAETQASLGLNVNYREAYQSHLLTRNGKEMLEGLFDESMINEVAPTVGLGFTKQRKIAQSIDEVNDAVRDLAAERAKKDSELAGWLTRKFGGADRESLSGLKFFEDDPMAIMTAHALAVHRAKFMAEMWEEASSMVSRMGWRKAPGRRDVVSDYKPPVRKRLQKLEAEMAKAEKRWSDIAERLHELGDDIPQEAQDVLDELGRQVSGMRSARNRLRNIAADTARLAKERAKLADQVGAAVTDPDVAAEIARIDRNMGKLADERNRIVSEFGGKIEGSNQEHISLLDDRIADAQERINNIRAEAGMEDISGLEEQLRQVDEELRTLGAEAADLRNKHRLPEDAVVADSRIAEAEQFLNDLRAKFAEVTEEERAKLLKELEAAERNLDDLLSQRKKGVEKSGTAEWLADETLIGGKGELATHGEQTQALLRNVPKMYADVIESVLNVPREPGLLLAGYQKMLQLWKGMATVGVWFLPGVGFHTRNFIGNAFNIYMSGVRDPRVFHRTNRIHRVVRGVSRKLARTDPNELFDDPAELHDTILRAVKNAPGLDADDQAIAMEAINRGLIGTNSFLGYIDSPAAARGASTNIETIKKAQKGDRRTRAAEKALGDTIAAKAATGATHPIRTSFKFGSAVEEWSRLAIMVDAAEKGMDFKSAAMHAKAMMVDYSDLSKWERKYIVETGLVPFYTWFRREASLMVTFMMSDPAFFHRVMMLQKATWEKWDPESEFVPGYYRNLGFPIPPSALSWFPGVSEEDVRFLSGEIFPHYALAEKIGGMMQPGLGDKMAHLLARNANPLLSTAGSVVRGEDLFSGSPLDSRRREADVVLGNLPFPVPGVTSQDAEGDIYQSAQQQYIVDQLFPPLGRGRQFFPRDEWAKDRRGRRWLSLTGLRSLPFSEATEKREAYRRIRDVQEVLDALEAQGHDVRGGNK